MVCNPQTGIIGHKEATELKARCSSKKATERYPR